MALPRLQQDPRLQNIDPSLLPPEMLGVNPNLPPGFVDGPAETPEALEQDFLDRQTVALNTETMGMPDLQSPVAPGFAQTQGGGPSGVPGGGQSGDPVMDQLMGRIEERGPVMPDPRDLALRRLKKPKKEQIEAIAERDRMRWAQTIERMAEDVAIFRQHTSSTPRSFRPDREERIKSAESSILVNKLSAMFAGTEMIYEVPYDDMMDEKSSQIIEDALYYLRKMAKRTYGFSGANLQRDEFFYMFLYGRYVKRILPDLHDPKYPFREALLDPATCFPTWGDEKSGLIRMVRKYSTTAGKVISAFGNGVPDLEAKIAKKLGYDTFTQAEDFWNEEGEMIEYHDQKYYFCSWKGIEIVPVTEHGFKRVPYVYIMPTGEPQSMSTPGGRYFTRSWDTDYAIPHLMSGEQDLAKKGVSVYHYLKHTHKVKEMLMTLLYNEVEKATDPATITYTAPHMMGQESPPLDTKRRGNNQRVMNFQQVEGIPTSPRPTDFSPLFMTVQDELIQGSLPPGAFGAEQGANTTASGITAMVQNAFDLVNPYIEAWQNGQAQEAQIKLEMYVDHIAPVITITAPEHDARGDGTGEVHDLSPMDIQAVGTYVDVKLAGLNMGNEAQMIAAMNQAVSGGLYSQRHAMNKLNIQNPDKMFAEIISEKAMQHPAMMDNFIIPEGFASQGMFDLAQLWYELVVAPQMMSMGQPGGPGGPGQPGQPQSGGGGEGSQQVPNPLQGMVGQQGSGGPPPGMGRGPSPESGGIM